MHRPRALAAIGGLLLSLILPSVALAHAELVSSSPAADAVVEAPLEAVVLTFDEAVVGASAFSVLDTEGMTIATGNPDPTDPTVMRAILPALGEGEYKVEWTSVAEDGDVERGTFSFNVVVPAPPVATPTAAPSDEPTTAPTPTTAASPDPTALPAPTGDGDNTTEVLLPIAIVGLLIGGGLAVILRRRPPA